MTILFPEAVKQQGNTTVAAVQTIADTAAPKLATEINAVSSVNVSCFLYSGGEGTTTTAKGEAPRRLCTTSTFSTFGNTTYDVSDLQYVYDPQGTDEDANAAREALSEGAEVYLVIRRGLAAETAAFGVGQKVDIWHVRLGPQNKTRTGDGEFDEFSITQSVAVIEAPVQDVTVAA